MPRTFRYHLRVRSYELDSFGHVNNAVYLQYLEAARADYMNQVGLSFKEFQCWERFPVVTKAVLEFRQMLDADDEVQIQGEVVDWKRTRFAINYRMVRTTDQSLVFIARTEFVFVNLAGRPVAIPQPFREAFDKGRRYGISGH